MLPAVTHVVVIKRKKIIESFVILLKPFNHSAAMSGKWRKKVGAHDPHVGWWQHRNDRKTVSVSVRATDMAHSSPSSTARMSG